MKYAGYRQSQGLGLYDLPFATIYKSGTFTCSTDDDSTHHHSDHRILLSHCLCRRWQNTAQVFAKQEYYKVNEQDCRNPDAGGRCLVGSGVVS